MKLIVVEFRFKVAWHDMDYLNADWSGSHCLVTEEKWTWVVVNTCCMDSSSMNMGCCCQSSERMGSRISR